MYITLSNLVIVTHSNLWDLCTLLVGALGCSAGGAELPTEACEESSPRGADPGLRAGAGRGRRGKGVPSHTKT